mgnify:CR=1 FL=1
MDRTLTTVHHNSELVFFRVIAFVLITGSDRERTNLFISYVGFNVMPLQRGAVDGDIPESVSFSK